jgi:hypothetical protein
MSNPTDWIVQPHAPIEKLSDRVWRVVGTIKNMELKRVMTIVKMADGRLTFHSPIALAPEQMSELEAWGEPAFVVVPNGWHRIDAPRFAARYPQAKVICPKGAFKRVREVVRVDGSYEDFPSDDIIQAEIPDGLGNAEGVFHVNDGQATLLVNDLIFNHPHGTGVAGFVFKHITKSTGGPRISRVFRWMVLKDKRALGSYLHALSKKPLNRIIVSHHEMITDSPSEVICQMAESL